MVKDAIRQKSDAHSAKPNCVPEYSIDGIIITEQDLKSIAHSLKVLDDDSMKDALELFVYNKKYDNAILIAKQRIVDIFTEYDFDSYVSFDSNVDGIMVLRVNILTPVPPNRQQSGKSFLRKLVDASITYFDIEIYANGLNNMTFIFSEIVGVREQMNITLKNMSKIRGIRKSRR